MLTALVRAIAIAALGAIAGAACVVFAFLFRPAFTLDMDRELPRNITGIYPPEVVPGAETFAWTGRSAKLNLPGFDRRVEWTCAVRFRGGRASSIPQPLFDAGVDGVSQARRLATNTFEDLAFAVPVAPGRSGVVFTFTSSTTFVPGPGDTRELGAQVDRFACRPASGLAFPPRRVDVDAMLAGAAMGAAYGSAGITAGSAAGAVVLLAIAQAFPLSAGPAPYNAYADRAPWLALWIGVAMVLAIKALAWPRQAIVRQTARFAIVWSGTVLYLKLLGLLHPSKELIDAVFQAHRLEAVLAGHYFFTQLMPSGVQFPYAIGLYLFSAPWSVLTRDHVTLLRIVVCSVDALAAAMIYPAVAKVWGDRLAAAIAVALFTVVPIDYWVIGNANLTNAFGQMVATIAVCAVVLGSRSNPRLPTIALWTMVIALALLSHVSTFAMVIVTLAALASFYRLFGGPPLRKPAYAVAIASVIAVLLSVFLYYGHFMDVYRNALRVRGASAAATQSATPPLPSRPATHEGRGRTAESFVLIGQALGLPILALAAAGTVAVVRRRTRDPLTLALAAWTIAFVAFVGVGLMRVEAQFERYSLEFVSRVAYAASPAVVILAGAGAASAWRSGPALRAVAVIGLALAMAAGLREWIVWW